MSGWQKILLVLVIIGALNWGLVGFFKFDLVAAIFGGQLTALSRTIFAIVGLAGLAIIPLVFWDRRDRREVHHEQHT